LRGQPRYVSSSYYQFRVIHSSILSLSNSLSLLFTQPIQLTTEFVLTLRFWLTCKILNILVCLSVLSLPDLAACHGNCLLRGPLVGIASLVHATPSMSPIPPLAAYSLLPLSHCIPPSYSSSYRTHLPNATNASYMPHLDASASAWHQLRRCSAHTYAILHTLFTNGCRLSPFSLPSVGACYRYLFSLNVGVSKIEIRDHSNTKTTTPLPTAKVTDETNNLAYTPTDANTNLTARSTVDDSSQNARCLSLEFEMLLDDSASVRRGVECWMSRFWFRHDRRCRRRRRASLRTRAQV